MTEHFTIDDKYAVTCERENTHEAHEFFRLKNLQRRRCWLLPNSRHCRLVKPFCSEVPVLVPSSEVDESQSDSWTLGARVPSSSSDSFSSPSCPDNDLIFERLRKLVDPKESTIPKPVTNVNAVASEVEASDSWELRNRVTSSVPSCPDNDLIFERLRKLVDPKESTIPKPVTNVNAVDASDSWELRNQVTRCSSSGEQTEHFRQKWANVGVIDFDTDDDLTKLTEQELADELLNM